MNGIEENVQADKMYWSCNVDVGVVSVIPVYSLCSINVYLTILEATAVFVCWVRLGDGRLRTIIFMSNSTTVDFEFTL